MSSFLTKLTEIGTPNLIEFDRDALSDEIVSRIKSDPNWSSLWDGELLQNASYMIINVFSYLFSKNAEAANRLLREVFLTEARDPRSISNILTSYGVSIKQNTASLVPVSVTSITGGYFVTSFSLPPGFRLTGKNINGSDVVFELYNSDPLDSTKINYGSTITVNAGIKNIINAYSGSTSIETFNIDASIQREKFIYKIPTTDIIEGSIRVYFQYGNSNETELISTETFVVPPIPSPDFPDGIPHYKIQYYLDGSCDLIFGTKTFGGYFPNDCTITVFYRSGGGSLSNISLFGINQTLSVVPVGLFAPISILFRNETSGGGGSDREDINEAQFYGPHRVGRGRAIVDDKDALNELVSSTIKHSVVSPKYSTDNTVPILHYWNYIVPERDFNSFIFPTPNFTDTASSYRITFERALDKFLNLDGIHDGEENNILFTTYDSSSSIFAASGFTSLDNTLSKRPPLNGTLKVQAYDRYNKNIDTLEWSGNYSGNTNSPDQLSFSATKVFNNDSSIIITAGSNDQFIFKVDDNGSNQTLSISPASYTPESLATALNVLAGNKNYFSVSSGKIVMSSLTKGETSSLTLNHLGVGTPSYNFLYNTLKGTKEYIDASPQNSRVFNSSTNFDFVNSTINFKFNPKVTSQTTSFQTYYGVITSWPSTSSDTGPTLTISLKDFNDKIIYTPQGTDVTVTLYNGSGQARSQLTFSNISYSSTNSGSSTTVGSVVTNPFDTINNYNWLTGEVTFKMIDDPIGTTVGGVTTYSFPKDTSTGGTTNHYDTSFYFTISYVEKNWQYITTTYTPDPYIAEGEALVKLNSLKGEGKRMMGIEPILKRVKFTPVLLSVTTTPTTGKSKNDVIVPTKNLIYTYFSYNNTNKDMQIGEAFSVIKTQSLLNDRLLNPNIAFAQITYLSVASCDPNEYQFILPIDFIERIKNFELNNSVGIDLTGLSSYYEPKVS